MVDASNSYLHACMHLDHVYLDLDLQADLKDMTFRPLLEISHHTNVSSMYNVTVP